MLADRAGPGGRRPAETAGGGTKPRPATAAGRGEGPDRPASRRQRRGRRVAALEGIGAEITPAKLRAFADVARERLRGPDGRCRRDHLRALAQRVGVAEGEVRIMGSRSNLLRTLAASGGVKSPTAGVPSFVPKWRRERDSNPRYGFPYTHFPGVRLQPLGHPSAPPHLPQPAAETNAICAQEESLRGGVAHPWAGGGMASIAASA